MSPFRTALAWCAAACVAAGASAAFYAFHQGLNRPVHALAIEARAQHPSLVPGRAFVDAFGGGYRVLAAHGAYLDAMQYVGSLLRTSEYKTYLYDLYDAVTDLDPQYADAYEQGPMLLAFSERDEPFTPLQKQGFAQQAVKLGEKGIRNLCDAKKVAAASGASDPYALADDPAVAEPCGEHDVVPYYLAFISYRYLKDQAAAARWYRVTAAHKAAPGAARYMALLMQGRAGDHEKTALTFLSLSAARGGEACRATAAVASQQLFPILRDGADARLDAPLLAAFSAANAALRADFGDDDDCVRNFTRALRETNLAYVERADAAFYKAKGRHAADAAELVRAGFARVAPADPTPRGDGTVGTYFWDAKESRWTWGVPPAK